MSFTVNGKALDPDSPEGQRMLALVSAAHSHLSSAPGIDGPAILEALARPGGKQHLAELLPLVQQHRRHEITDADFDAAQRRILGEN